MDVSLRRDHHPYRAAHVSVAATSLTDRSAGL
jgi:hypothetical protein